MQEKTSIYRVRISLDHPGDEEIYRDVYMSVDCTLSVLKDIILKIFKLNRKMIASFYICNEKGELEEEVVSPELGEDTGHKVLEAVNLLSLIEAKKNLVFAAHGLKVRLFHVEIFGKIDAAAIQGALPQVVKTQGEIPRSKKTEEE